MEDCRDGVFVDVGAHKGQYTTLYAEYAHVVYAFEPGPEQFAALQEACRGLRNVRLYNTGLSDEPGLLRDQQFFNAFMLGSVSSPPRWLDGSCAIPRSFPDQPPFDVTLATLDDLELTQLDFLKVDVDGYDYKVLMGGKRTIELDLPYIMLELCYYVDVICPGDSRRLVDWMFDAGYRVYRADTGEELHRPHESWWPHNSSFDVFLIHPERLGC